MLVDGEEMSQHTQWGHEWSSGSTGTIWLIVVTHDDENGDDWLTWRADEAAAHAGMMLTAEIAASIGVQFVHNV